MGKGFEGKRSIRKAVGSGKKVGHANVDAPKGSFASKAGFTHEKQTQGHSIGWSYSPGRGVGGAPHHQGSTFGGKTDCIRGAKPTLPGGQSIK